MGFKLFGVSIDSDDVDEHDQDQCSYVRDAVAPGETNPCSTTSTINQAEVSNLRKRAAPWTEEEHQKFLEGLEIYGKGSWKKISRYMQTRIPSQVASHAQKYFIRLNAKKKSKRLSIFDVSLKQEATKNSSSQTSSESSLQNNEPPNASNKQLSLLPLQSQDEASMVSQKANLCPGTMSGELSVVARNKASGFFWQVNTNPGQNAGSLSIVTFPVRFLPGRSFAGPYGFCYMKQ